jgi:hypothetical protein
MASHLSPIFTSPEQAFSMFAHYFIPLPEFDYFLIFFIYYKNQFRADLFCTYHMLARQFILFVALLPSLVSGDAAWIEENKAFLKENKNAPFVHELPSGLQYKILVPGGEGPHPKATSPCTCHYSGKLING